jgi:hypothetical protein
LSGGDCGSDDGAVAARADETRRAAIATGANPAPNVVTRLTMRALAARENCVQTRLKVFFSLGP